MVMEIRCTIKPPLETVWESGPTTAVRTEEHVRENAADAECLRRASPARLWRELSTDFATKAVGLKFRFPLEAAEVLVQCASKLEAVVLGRHFLAHDAPEAGTEH